MEPRFSISRKKYLKETGEDDRACLSTPNLTIHTGLLVKGEVTQKRQETVRQVTRYTYIPCPTQNFRQSNVVDLDRYYHNQSHRISHTPGTGMKWACLWSQSVVKDYKDYSLTLAWPRNKEFCLILTYLDSPIPQATQIINRCCAYVLEFSHIYEEVAWG